MCNNFKTEDCSSMCICIRDKGELPYRAFIKAEPVGREFIIGS